VTAGYRCDAGEQEPAITRAAHASR
jgi:hypothetical protein